MAKFKNPILMAGTKGAPIQKNYSSPIRKDNNDDDNNSSEYATKKARGANQFEKIINSEVGQYALKAIIDRIVSGKGRRDNFPGMS